jgi:NAD(P)-dependent dehydrogenase (short-subunit alcohol dehydrogenase family)
MAIVTGAGAGIGRAIARKFAASGASLCLLDISRTQAETVATKITRAGGTASAYECDVSDRDSIESTFHTILQQGRRDRGNGSLPAFCPGRAHHRPAFVRGWRLRAP